MLIRARRRALGHGPWAMGPGPWALGPGPWAMGHGPWAMGRGPWAMGPGPWALGQISSLNALMKKTPVVDVVPQILHLSKIDTAIKI